MEEGKSIVGHFVKRFTLIDFLGYTVPGAAIILLSEYYLGGIKELWTNFFGNQVVLLTVYFILLSYLAGTVLHEISQPIDYIISGILSIKVCEKYYKKESFKNRIDQLFLSLKEEKNSEPDASSQEKSNEDDLQKKTKTSLFKKIQETVAMVNYQNKCFRKIFHYVQPETENSKIPLFQAFATFSRIASLTSFLTALACQFHLVLQDVRIEAIMTTLLLGFILLERCWRFNKLITEYVYDIFEQKKMP